MKTKYGTLSSTHINSALLNLRKSIFFLLLYVDPETKGDYNIDIAEAFRNLQYRLHGLNSLLTSSAELVTVISLLETAQMEYDKGEEFDFGIYRKLILDAGAEVMKVKERD